MLAKGGITEASNGAHTPLQKEGKGDFIEAAAQAVLDARNAEETRCAEQGQKCSLAQMYAAGNMPDALNKAHAQLDKAVDSAYGYKPALSRAEGGKKDDAERVAFLFERYQNLLAS